MYTRSIHIKGTDKGSALLMTQMPMPMVLGALARIASLLAVVSEFLSSRLDALQFVEGPFEHTASVAVNPDRPVDGITRRPPWQRVDSITLRLFWRRRRRCCRRFCRTPRLRPSRSLLGSCGRRALPPIRRRRTSRAGARPLHPAHGIGCRS